MKSLTLASGAVAMLCATSALAQEAALVVPKPFSVPGRHGVDFLSGHLSHSPTSISIGTGPGALTFRPVMTDRGRWTNNFVGSVVEACEWNYDSNICEWERGLYRTVTIGDAYSAVFEEQPDGSWRPNDGPSATLTGSGGNWTYTAHDGTVAVFASPPVWEFNGEAGPNFKQTSLAAISTLTKPNGEKLTFHYRQDPGGFSVLSSVTSNLGYQLFFETASSGAPEITKAVAINNAVESCAPTAATCSLSGAWPTLTFGRTTSAITVTDTLGRTTTYGYGVPEPYHRNRVIGVRRPGRTSGYDMTFTYRRYVSNPPEEFPFIEHYGPVKSVTTDEGFWGYGSSYHGASRTVTDPSSAGTTYEWGEFGISRTPRLERVTDPLGRVWRNTYTASATTGTLLAAVIQPEGNHTSYVYDARGNVTEVREGSKTPGTPADVVQSATYAASCLNLVTCNLPLTTTDARGGVTDYTYDAAGNLLTVTGPAPTPGAARPRTVYTWEQRYAWYKQNGSSAITQASSPVWVMTSQYSCMTGATC